MIELTEDRFKSKNIALLSVAILLIIMVFSSMVSWPFLKQERLYIVKESPIQKIPHQLKSGENYVYLYASGNESATLHYSLVQRSNCLEFTIVEIKSNLTSCIKIDGTDSSNSNLTLNDQFVYFFRPWMLAVKPDWVWNVSIYTNITTESKIGGFDFKYYGETKYLGREAYIVKQRESGSDYESTIIIDKEKRVLLKEEGKMYTAEIISGPFPLEQQAG